MAEKLNLVFPGFGWLFISFALMFTACDDSISPQAPDTFQQQLDTTSHTFTWEAFSFSGGTRLAPILNYVLVVSDTEIWLTGDIKIDTLVYSIPHGYPRTRVNAIRYDGKQFKEMLIEGIKNDGSVNSTYIFGAFRSYGFTVFITSMGCTEFRGDSILFHDLRDMPYVGRTHNIVDQAISGNVFYYGGGGSLGKLVRKVPSAEIISESVFLPTEVPVASLAEVGRDQYYVSCWWLDTGESHLWKLDHGNIAPATIGGESDTSEYWFQSLWCANNILFAIHKQELVVQDVKDENKYVRYDIPRINGKQGVIRKMSGASVNDIFFVGDFGRVFHFNGNSVNKYDEVGELCPTASFLDVTVTKNKVYIVGEDYRANRALLLVGTRMDK